MATILSVSKYINSQVENLNAMKLQKLVYYAQVWNMVWEENELFKEDFKACINGPISEILYEVHDGHFLISEEMFKNIKNDLTETEKENIDKVIEFYSNKTAQWLIDLSRMEDPWINEIKKVKSDNKCLGIINKGDIHMYYSGLHANA